jgi:acyl carrier protein
MTLSSLSSTQRTAPQEDFDTDKVRTLIAEYLGVDVRRVTDEAHFREELGAGWLDRLELMILIEDEFAGVEITDNDADQFKVVGDLIRHIETTNNEQRAVKSPRNAGPVLPESCLPVGDADRQPSAGKCVECSRSAGPSRSWSAQQ